MAKKRRKTCFVLMPFAGEFDDVYRIAIKPAVQAEGLDCRRADEVFRPGAIMRDIYQSIYQADIIIVDVSRTNPNVYYELGIAHTLGKNVIVLSQSLEGIPFDIRAYRCLTYKLTPSGIQELIDALRRTIEETLRSGMSGSPVLDAIPAMETVPKKKFDALAQEVESLKQALGSRDREVAALQKKRQGTQQGLAAPEMKKYLKALIEDVVAKREREFAETQAELNRSKQQNEAGELAMREIRRLKRMTLVNPHWKGRNFSVEEDLCFLLMPFRKAWSDDVWKLIDGIVSQSGFRCQRADEKDGRIVMDDIWEGISKARVVVADLTARNPNVTYEVGLADVLGKEVVLLSQTPEDVPFDFLGIRLITYENTIAGVRKLSEALSKRLAALRAQHSATPETEQSLPADAEDAAAEG